MLKFVNTRADCSSVSRSNNVKIQIIVFASTNLEIYIDIDFARFEAMNHNMINVFLFEK